MTINQAAADQAVELAYVLHDLISALPPEFKATAYSLVDQCAANPTLENRWALVDYILPKREGGVA